MLEPEGYPDYPLDELLADLKKRRGFVDGVVVSGGEPTIDAGLPAFLRELKALQLQVKLDSNGLAPQVLSALLEEELVDYLAIDIKTAPRRYQELHTGPVRVDALRETVALLRDCAVAVEYRTTCIPELVAENELTEMAQLLEGAPLWVLQQFVPAHAMVPTWQQMEPYAASRLQSFARHIEPFVKEVRLRGI